MKKCNTVETKDRAKEVIMNHITKNNLNYGCFKDSSDSCGCGETKTLLWFNNDYMLKAAYCDSCGDDNNPDNEVLVVK